MAEVPDSTAVRTALWRARHVELDAAPHVVDDVVGLRLLDPDPSWRDRPDMDPGGTRGPRATSRPANRGGNGSSTPGSTRTDPPSSPRPACRCT